MIKPYDKEASNKIKDEILKLLDKKPMTFKEIYDVYKNEHKRNSVSNWLQSIRAIGLIEIDETVKYQPYKKYYRVGTKTFTQAIEERISGNNEKRKQAYHKKQEEIVTHPNARIIRMEDLGHRSKGNKSKISPWQGYSTMDLL